MIRMPKWLDQKVRPYTPARDQNMWQELLKTVHNPDKAEAARNVMAADQKWIKKNMD